MQLCLILFSLIARVHLRYVVTSFTALTRLQEIVVSADFVRPRQRVFHVSLSFRPSLCYCDPALFHGMYYIMALCRPTVKCNKMCLYAVRTNGKDSQCETSVLYNTMVKRRSAVLSAAVLNILTKGAQGRILWDIGERTLYFFRCRFPRVACGQQGDLSTEMATLGIPQYTHSPKIRFCCSNTRHFNGKWMNIQYCQNYFHSFNFNFSLRILQTAVIAHSSNRCQSIAVIKPTVRAGISRAFLERVLQISLGQSSLA